MVPYLLLVYVVYFFFFKQKTAYEMRISDWSSDVCSSDLRRQDHDRGGDIAAGLHPRRGRLACDRGTHHPAARDHRVGVARISGDAAGVDAGDAARQVEDGVPARRLRRADPGRGPADEIGRAHV